MTIKLASLKADLKREFDGDWVDYPIWEGVAFKVSSFNKPEYQTARDLALRKLAQKLGGKPPSEIERRAVIGAVIAEHILHDWRGFDVAYSTDVATEYLTSAEGYHVYNAVEWCANQLTAVKIEFQEGAAGKSEQLSDGSSKGSKATAG